MIYSQDGLYVAFCDAAKFEGKYYCVFREGENHAPYHEWHQNGYLIILSSSDLLNWEEEMVIKDDDWDLRDPCFCVVDDNLFLYYGLYSFAIPTPYFKTRLTRLTNEGGKLHIVNSEKVDIGEYSKHWLWKVYYSDGLFYGTTYFEDRPVNYVTSSDGVHFSKVSEVTEKGSETSLVDFNENRIGIVRSPVSKGNSLLAISSRPYAIWNCYELNEMIESPECFIYADDIYVIGRSRNGMSMFRLDVNLKCVIPVFNFFALGDYGDRGYPGVVVENNEVNVFYYAVNPRTNETAIFQTKIYF